MDEIYDYNIIDFNDILNDNNYNIDINLFKNLNFTNLESSKLVINTILNNNIKNIVIVKNLFVDLCYNYDHVSNSYFMMLYQNVLTRTPIYCGTLRCIMRNYKLCNIYAEDVIVIGSIIINLVSNTQFKNINLGTLYNDIFDVFYFMSTYSNYNLNLLINKYLLNTIHFLDKISLFNPNHKIIINNINFSNKQITSLLNFDIFKIVASNYYFYNSFKNLNNLQSRQDLLFNNLLSMFHFLYNNKHQTYNLIAQYLEYAFSDVSICNAFINVVNNRSLKFYETILDIIPILCIIYSKKNISEKTILKILKDNNLDIETQFISNQIYKDVIFFNDSYKFFCILQFLTDTYNDDGTLFFNIYKYPICIIKFLLCILNKKILIMCKNYISPFEHQNNNINNDMYQQCYISSIQLIFNNFIKYDNVFIFDNFMINFKNKNSNLALTSNNINLCIDYNMLYYNCKDNLQILNINPNNDLNILNTIYKNYMEYVINIINNNICVNISFYEHIFNFIFNKFNNNTINNKFDTYSNLFNLETNKYSIDMYKNKVESKKIINICIYISLHLSESYYKFILNIILENSVNTVDENCVFFYDSLYNYLSSKSNASDLLSNLICYTTKHFDVTTYRLYYLTFINLLNDIISNISNNFTNLKSNKKYLFLQSDNVINALNEDYNFEKNKLNYYNTAVVYITPDPNNIIKIITMLNNIFFNYKLYNLMMQLLNSNIFKININFQTYQENNSIYISWNEFQPNEDNITNIINKTPNKIYHIKYDNISIGIGVKREYINRIINHIIEHNFIEYENYLIPNNNTNLQHIKFIVNTILVQDMLIFAKLHPFVYYLLKINIMSHNKLNDYYNNLNKYEQFIKLFGQEILDMIPESKYLSLNALKTLDKNDISEYYPDLNQKTYDIDLLKYLKNTIKNKLTNELYNNLENFTTSLQNNFPLNLLLCSTNYISNYIYYKIIDIDYINNFIKYLKITSSVASSEHIIVYKNTISTFLTNLLENNYDDLVFFFKLWFNNIINNLSETDYKIIIIVNPSYKPITIHTCFNLLRVNYYDNINEITDNFTTDLNNLIISQKKSQDIGLVYTDI